MTTTEAHVAGRVVHHLWCLRIPKWAWCSKPVICRSRLLPVSWNVQRVHCHNTAVHLQQPVLLDGASFNFTRACPGREHLRQCIGALSSASHPSLSNHNFTTRTSSNSTRAKASHTRRRYWPLSGSHVLQMMMTTSCRICEAAVTQL